MASSRDSVVQKSLIMSVLSYSKGECFIKKTFETCLSNKELFYITAELQTGEMKALVVGTLLCSALSWIILLAGVAAMQANCSADNLLFGGTAGYNGPVDCSNFFGYAWWITWFQFVMIIVVAVALASLERFKALLLAFLAMVTVLLMDTSNSYLYYNNLRVANAGLVGLSSPRTASAGAIMSTIFNFILMILVGIYDDDTGAGFKQGPAAAAPPVGTSAQV